MDDARGGDGRTAGMLRFHSPAGSPEAKAKATKRLATQAGQKAAGLPCAQGVTQRANAAKRHKATNDALDAALLEPAASKRWTLAKQLAFLTALGETGRVDRAMRVTGMNTTSLYALRRRDRAFAAAWGDALACHADLAEAIVLEKAVHGYEREKDENGEPRVISERLMVEVLRHRGVRAAIQRDAVLDADAGKAGETARLKFEVVMQAIAVRVAEAT